jgi:TusA-related sulfurtransferase
MAASSTPTIDIESLGLEQGALLLIRCALAELPAGGELRVQGTAPAWDIHLEAWCRQQGHGVRFSKNESGATQALLTRASHAEGRWHGAQSAGPAAYLNGNKLSSATARCANLFLRLLREQC